MAKQFNLKKLTDNAWIADTNGSPVAFIYRKDEKFHYVTDEGIKEFDKLNDIKIFLGGKVSEEVAEASDGLEDAAQEMIDGFPVKHSNIAVECGGERPVYARGKTQHVAGYWCINFGKRWVPSFCPLLKTVEQYQSTGPFKNRLEMMIELTALNRNF